MCRAPDVIDVEQAMEKVFPETLGVHICSMGGVMVVHVVCVDWCWAVPVIGNECRFDCDGTSNDWDEVVLV